MAAGSKALLRPFGVSDGTVRGTFRPSRALLRGPAAGFLTVRITDWLTPAVMAAREAAPAMVRAGYMNAARSMERNIKRRFQEGPNVWAKLKPSAVRWKASHGVPWPDWTLRETLTLQSNVNRLKVNVRGRGKQQVSLEIPESAFWSSPYVIYHELGWGQTRRGFIKEGIMDTYKDVEIAVAGTVGRLWHILQRPLAEGIPAREDGFQIIPFAGMPMRSFIMGLLMPPSALWAVIGAASDARSLVRGHFTGGMVLAWLRNWGLGQFGMTAKVQRRRLRRALWRRQ